MTATANIKLVGTTSKNEVDVSVDNAMFIEARSSTIGAGGVYAISVASNSISFTNTVPFPLFSFRWTHPTMKCIINRITVNALIDTAVTPGGDIDLALTATIGRNYTIDANSGNTITISGTQNDQKFRTSHAPTAIQSTSITIANNTALTKGTVAEDQNSAQFTNGTVYQELSCLVGYTTPTVIGVWLFGNNNGSIPILDYTQPGLQPLILSRYEGVLIDLEGPDNPPVTGTFVIVVNVEWQEVPVY